MTAEDLSAIAARNKPILNTLGRVGGVVAVSLIVANCAGPGPASRSGGGIDPKYGVAASPRVVADGQPVPKGGGREMVGKSYTVAGRVYTPRHNPNYVAEGLASWYGSAFHGRQTANGEVFDRESIAAAHPTMPLPSYARVTNLRNKRSMIVRVNDRGPFHENRVIDLSERAAQALDFHRAGVARVKVEYMGRASVRGSDDRKLLATLNVDGAPASFPGAGATQFAGGPSVAPARAPSTALALASTAPAPIAVPALSPIVRTGTGAAPQRVELSSTSPQLPGGAAAEAALEETDLDLVTIPHAGVPTAFAVPPLRSSRSQVAGMFYAPLETPAATFAKRSPFAGLAPAGFSATR